MLNYQVIAHKSSKEFITFVHGAGGSSAIWYKQIKAFSKHYNLLLIDLRGHGKSQNNLITIKKYNFKILTEDILEVLNHLKLDKTHFMGISLGTILIREIAETYPHRVESMILAGAVMKINFRGRILIKLGNYTKNFIPYLLLYKLFAHVIMPKRAHKKSRNIFINEAKKLYQKEFIRWFTLTSQLKPLLKLFRSKTTNIPTLFIMGEHDHMFLPSIQKMLKDQQEAKLSIISNAGHVVNLDQPLDFNLNVLNFLKNLETN